MIKTIKLEYIIEKKKGGKEEEENMNVLFMRLNLNLILRLKEV